MLRNRLVRDIRLAFEFTETSGGRGGAYFCDAQNCAKAPEVQRRCGVSTPASFCCTAALRGVSNRSNAANQIITTWRSEINRFCIALMAGAASLSLVSSVYGSDLPLAGVIEAHQPADAMSWSGCSVGASVGYLSQTTDTVLAAGLFDGGSHDAQGGSVGLRAGCDVQMDRVVLGLVGTIDITDASASNDFYPVGLGFPEYITTEINWFGSLKGRVGYLADPSLLLYGTAGLAFINNTHTDYDTTPVMSFLGTAESTRMGYVLGIGAEYALADGWSVFAEYNYMDFGQKDLEMVDGVIYPGNWVNTYDNSAHAISIGVNYRF